jgi:CheY-like chemotaxis protein
LVRLNAAVRFAKETEAPRRVLLVDDDIEVIRALKEALGRNGYLVDTYNDPSEALSRYEAGRYELAILDIRMARMDGIELHRRMKEISPRQRFCFLSAYDTEYLKFRPRNVPFLKKPVVLSDLERQVGRRPRASRRTSRRTG